MLRCVSSGLFLSHGFRNDSEVLIQLLGEPDPPKLVRFVGPEIRGMNPDERSIAGLVKKALGVRIPRGLIKNPSDGIYIERKDVKEVLSGYENIIYLHEDGEDISGFEIPDNPLFVLGDDVGLTPELEELLGGASRISLGPEILHSNHCITLIHNKLDRD